MRCRLTTLVTLAACGLLPACGGDTPTASAPQPAVAAPPPVPQPAGFPQISFAKTTHDFGVISDTTNHKASFPFTNSGTGKLVVTNVRPGCGCTTPTLDRTEFLPGEGSSIEVVFDPFRKSGPQNRPITVTTNAQPGSVTRLAIVADVRPLVRPESYTVRLGTLERSRPHTATFSLFHSDPDLEITRLSVTNPHITARVLEAGLPAADEPGYRSTIEVTVATDVAWGQLIDTQVTLVARGRLAPDLELVENFYSVQLAGSVYGDLRCQPAVLSADAIRGNPFGINALLFRTSGDPFTITGASVTGATADVRFEPIGDSSYRVIVEGRAPAEPRSIRGSVTIQTDVPGETDLVIPLSIIVR